MDRFPALPLYESLERYGGPAEFARLCELAERMAERNRLTTPWRTAVDELADLHGDGVTVLVFDNKLYRHFEPGQRDIRYRHRVEKFYWDANHAHGRKTISKWLKRQLNAKPGWYWYADITYPEMLPYVRIDVKQAAAAEVKELERRISQWKGTPGRLRDWDATAR